MLHWLVLRWQWLKVRLRYSALVWRGHIGYIAVENADGTQIYPVLLNPVRRPRFRRKPRTWPYRVGANYAD